MLPGCCKGPCNHEIVLVRHGESEWNQQNLFCGWVDVGLSDKGKEEAEQAANAIKKAGYRFHVAFTSVLSRAQATLDTILKTIEQPNIEVVRSWQLNERHYGALTGLNKTETANQYGEEQVQLWRRSYDVPPPPMEEDHPYYKQIIEDRRYAEGPPRNKFPRFESLKMTMERVLPFWEEKIGPEIKIGRRVLIVAHGNSLRSLVKHLEQVSDADIVNLDLPTGIPFAYTLDGQLKVFPGQHMQFLGDPETVKKAMEAVHNQGKANVDH
ncbi:hypothetical protein Trydic_g13654 [Trypoxylus dichotomus]